MVVGDEKWELCEAPLDTNVCCWCLEQTEMCAQRGAPWKKCRDTKAARRKEGKQDYTHEPTSWGHLLCEKCAVELGAMW